MSCCSFQESGFFLGREPSTLVCLLNSRGIITHLFRRTHLSLLFGSLFPRRPHHAVLATCKAVPDRRRLQTSPLFFTPRTASLRSPCVALFPSHKAETPSIFWGHTASGRTLPSSTYLRSKVSTYFTSLLFRAGLLLVVWLPVLQTLGRTRTPAVQPISLAHPSSTSTRSSRSST